MDGWSCLATDSSTGGGFVRKIYSVMLLGAALSNGEADLAINGEQHSASRVVA